MKNTKNNNSGFTLVELIIAMAVLAFLMTAVSTFMGSSVVTHRKQKAEIQVHTSAQETYNQISDSVMQAKEVVIIGYEASSEYDFSKPGTDVGAAPELVYYVKNEEMKDFIKNNPSVFGTDGAAAAGDTRIKYFKDFDPDNVIYVKKMAFMTSVPIDLTAVPVRSVLMLGSDEMWLADALADPADPIKKIKIAVNASGVETYSENDNVVHIYSFEGKDMYYERQYSFMTTLNDMIDPSDASSKKACLYNGALSYVEATGATDNKISGCAVKINANDGAIGVDLMFNDKNMTYKTEGMINIRNSYVLKGKDN